MWKLFGHWDWTVYRYESALEENAKPEVSSSRRILLPQMTCCALLSAWHYWLRTWGQRNGGIVTTPNKENSRKTWKFYLKTLSRRFIYSFWRGNTNSLSGFCPWTYTQLTSRCARNKVKITTGLQPSRTLCKEHRVISKGKRHTKNSIFRFVQFLPWRKLLSSTVSHSFRRTPFQ